MAEGNNKEYHKLDFMDQEHPKTKLIEEMAKKVFKNKNTKFNSEALNAFSAIIKIFIGEAAARAATEAKKDPFIHEEITVTKEHLEKVLPQLMLEF